MKTFTYERAGSAAEAVAILTGRPDARIIAGGTNLLDLMKLQIETPGHVIDVNGAGFDRIDPTGAGGLRVGALVRNTDLAAHDTVRRRDYGVLTRALVAGASGAASQPCDDGGQPDATHPLPLLLRHRNGLQQARSGFGL